MKISKLLPDEAILCEMGVRIMRRRLELELTQAAAAEQAGVAKRTLERVEAGRSAQMSSLIRILRVLDSLPGLDRMLPEAVRGPMDLLKRKGKRRQRVSTGRASNRPKKPWSWDDKS